MNSGEDNTGRKDGNFRDGGGGRRHSIQSFENSNKRHRHYSPDTINLMDLRRISQQSLSGGLHPGQAMSINQLASLRNAAASYIGNNLASPASFASSPSISNHNYLSQSYVDQRLFEHAKQQLRQGADIAAISNLFQSSAIPAGNTDFVFSPTISIPVARSILNHQPGSSTSLSMSDSSSLLSAVALLQGRQCLLDPFASQQGHWESRGMQQSVEHAVQSAIANARQQEQLQQMQNASLAQELLQRYLASSAEQSAVAATFSDEVITQHQQAAKSKKQLSFNKSSDGVLLAIPEDHCKLNDQQVYLREQIEAYPATEDDLTSHTRGRNKPISLRQIGIRCKHCNHLPTSQRGKGSTYFPSTLMGIYQAAQNMSVEHLQSGICSEMPPDIRNRFLTFGLTKPGASVAGKRYWAGAAKHIGLVDTDNGIRFAKDEQSEVAETAQVDETIETPTASSMED